MALPVSFSDIEAAATRIQGRAMRTPLIGSPALSEEFAARVFLKPECLQRTGSFKFRGAYNAVMAAGPAARAGVVACSSGNHAQGLAEAARLAGVPATIVMPADAPQVKMQRTRASGARIVTYDRASQDRDEIAAELIAQDGGLLVHPYNDPKVIAGQGTVGLEIAAELAGMRLAPDVVLAPCSGGGLVAGVALAVTERAPPCRVMAVEPEGFDDYARSLAADRIVGNERSSGSVCDALLAPEPGEMSFAINRQKLSGSIAVSDEAALRAVGFAYERFRLVLEPGGAVALAALIDGKVDVRGSVVVIVLSGGNIDDAMLARALAVYRSG
ncbi:threonine ammonia-lyase [Afifella pfennigii]|uniref:threonine ammonia-lyase n=1 Tax=Afifella pfennigii TaxID=209897 RepID=UPI00047D2DCE|nr:threonine/serine dehydratase [Afifella pfennigii]